MGIIRRIGRAVDQASEWSGQVGKWLVPTLIFLITYDTMARYLFNAPTSWSYILSYMLGSSLIVLGSPYVYLHKRAIKIDLIYNRLSPKSRRILDLTLTLLLTIPFCLVAFLVFLQDTLLAYKVGEVAIESVWYPKLWPHKAVITIGFLILLLQVIVTFFRDLHPGMPEGVSDD